MKRLGIVVAALVLLAAGAAVAYGALGLSQAAGVTLTGCLTREGHLTNVAVGPKPSRRCDRHDTQVALGNGDITAVVAGAGLDGGAQGGDATVEIGQSYRLPQTCAANETATWNGTAWSCADPLSRISVTPLAAGDSSCPNGGVAILIGLLKPSPVCNGADGKNGTLTGKLASANGLFTLTVGDNGILLRGPRASVTISRAGLQMNTIGGSTP